MGYNFKETMNKPERFAPGHRMCAVVEQQFVQEMYFVGFRNADKAVIR